MKPDFTDPIWEKLIQGEANPDLEYMPFKLILMRLKMDYRFEPTDKKMKECLADLEKFYENVKEVPKVQNDIITISKI